MTDLTLLAGTDILTKELTADELVAAACRQTGLSNLGAPEFIEPFRRLLSGAASEIQFHPLGRMSFNADVIRLLVNRLRFEEDLRRHPEILEEDVADPIIVIGLVRTGTSKLQRMMSADPYVQKLLFWRLFNPAPFPNAPTNGPDPRIEVARQATAMLGQLSPDFMAAHPTLAEEVDEELLLLEFTFESLVLYLLNPTRSYYEWMKDRSLHHTYRYLKQLLQYLQWQDGGKRNRPWIMKSPLHIGNLDAMLEVFPKATIVHCHRDVSEITASFSSLSEAGWRLKTNAVDPHEVGQTMLELWSNEMKKYLKLRDLLAPHLNIIDVSYEQINQDPISIIAILYQRAGRLLGDESIVAMRAWERNNPQNRFGKNMYTLERFGLTVESINAAFESYVERFGRYIKKGAFRAD